MLSNSHQVEEFGYALHSCATDYSSDVRRRACLIVVLKHKGRFAFFLLTVFFCTWFALRRSFVALISLFVRARRDGRRLAY